MPLSCSAKRMIHRDKGWAATVLAVVAVLSGAATGVLAQTQDVPSLTVIGAGEAATRPDIVEIQAGVITEAATARAALDANTKSMASLMQTVGSFDIEERDVQTSSFNVSPTYSRRQRGDNEPPQISGYRVENRVSLTIRHIDRLGQVLDAFVSGGANTLHGIRFDVADPQPVLDEARREAVADARRKAQLYTESAGVTLGRVLEIREEGVSAPRPPQVFARAMAAESSVPVAAGESTFFSRVVMTFELAGQ